MNICADVKLLSRTHYAVTSNNNNDNNSFTTMSLTNTLNKLNYIQLATVRVKLETLILQGVVL